MPRFGEHPARSDASCADLAAARMFSWASFMSRLVLIRLKRAVPRHVWVRARARWWQMKQALELDHSAVQWPWFRRPGRAELSFLHLQAVSLERRRFQSVESKLAVWTMSSLSPLVVLAHIARGLQKHGTYVARVEGVGRVRQAAEMFWLALRYNCPPKSYYKFRLFDSSRPLSSSLNYLHEFQLVRLLSSLNRPRPSTRTLNNKRDLSAIARMRGLAAAGPVVTFHNRSVQQWFTESERLPLRDLVMKAVDLQCGFWFELWMHRDGVWIGPHGRGLDEAELLDYVSSRSEDRDCLLQERLINHEHLASLCGRGLATLRIVTYRSADSTPRILMSSFRMPTGEGIVDNFAAGGIAAPVDFETGRLGVAIGKDVSRGQFREHPDSGAPIAGTALPFWPEAQRLALDAQRLFNDVPFVGWDIVLGPDGPTLLEANTTWCGDLVQMTHDRPLTQTAFLAVYLEHLAESGDGEAGATETCLQADSRQPVTKPSVAIERRCRVDQTQAESETLISYSARTSGPGVCAEDTRAD